jgi:hypothetical protein
VSILGRAKGGGGAVRCGAVWFSCVGQKAGRGVSTSANGIIGKGASVEVSEWSHCDRHKHTG